MEESNEPVTVVRVWVLAGSGNQVVAQPFDAEGRPAGPQAPIASRHDLIVLGDRYDVGLDLFEFEDGAAELIEGH